jgi:hypothetical protein
MRVIVGLHLEVQALTGQEELHEHDILFQRQWFLISVVDQPNPGSCVIRFVKTFSSEVNTKLDSVPRSKKEDKTNERIILVFLISSDLVDQN